MCTYCNMGDHAFRFTPPWQQDHYPPWPPEVPRPAPMTPIVPWGLDALREYHRLLKEVREMEEKIGCPCEPNKADYIRLFEERIAELERREKERGGGQTGTPFAPGGNE